MRKKMAILLIGLLAALCIAVLLSGCKKEEEGVVTGVKNKLSAEGLCQMRYTEGDFEIFLDTSYENTRIVVTNEDGTKHQYYPKGHEVFDELSKKIDAFDMLDWGYLDTEDVEKAEGTEIKITARIVSRDYTFGTQRMPKGGIDLLHELKDIALSYGKDDDEIRTFTVEINGKTYNTVSGTGNSVGTGAEIDFGEDKWWEVEHFTGRYELTEKAIEVMKKEMGTSGVDFVEYDTAFFEITPDGQITFQAGDEELYEGTVDAARLYGCYATGAGFEFDFYQSEDGPDENFIEVRRRGEPYPVNTPGYQIYLERK